MLKYNQRNHLHKIGRELGVMDDWYSNSDRYIRDEVQMGSTSAIQTSSTIWTVDSTKRFSELFKKWQKIKKVRDWYLQTKCNSFNVQPEDYSNPRCKWDSSNKLLLKTVKSSKFAHLALLDYGSAEISVT
jgi:hypothetical protein